MLIILDKNFKKTTTKQESLGNRVNRQIVSRVTFGKWNFVRNSVYIIFHVGRKRVIFFRSIWNIILPWLKYEYIWFLIKMNKNYMSAKCIQRKLLNLFKSSYNNILFKITDVFIMKHSISWQQIFTPLD